MNNDYQNLSVRVLHGPTVHDKPNDLYVTVNASPDGSDSVAVLKSKIAVRFSFISSASDNQKLHH